MSELTVDDHILSALRVIGPMSSIELHRFIGGVSKTLVIERLRALRKTKKLYVGFWRKPVFRGRWCPVYKIGAGKDVSMPAAKSHAMRCQTYRERHKEKIAAKRRKGGMPPAGPFDGLLR